MKNRYLALDIFRGMTIAFMILVNTPGSWAYVFPPLRHAKWHGVTPTDLVFPSFVFIVGVSMRFSFATFNYQLDAALRNKILKRSFLIFLIGVLLAMFPFYDVNLEKLRILGVLQRIALTYCAVAFIVLLVKEKWLPYVTGLVLLGYWAILYFFGDIGMQYEMLTNAGQKLDLWLIGPNHLYKGEGVPFDPEGLLSTLPTMGTALLGYLTGMYLQKQDKKENTISDFSIFGISLILVALIWDKFFGFPINKKIWTSSYVLFCAGVDLIVLAALIYFIDILGKQKWFKFFHVFGVNSMAAYVIGGLIAKIMLKTKIKDTSLYNWLYSNVFQPIFGNYMGSFLFAIAVVALTWLCLLWMYRKKIFFKV